MQPAPTLWDISPPVEPRAQVFPGDTRYSQVWGAQIGPGCPVNVSAITMSPHVGAHADAPLHYRADGLAVGLLDLQPYVGHCRVLHALGCGPLIDVAHLLRPGSPPLPPRVLVRTYAQAPLWQFDETLSAFAPATVHWLADQGVQLIGIDTASVDPAASKTLDSHQVLAQRDLRVLENLRLDDVPEGDYELIALPLALTQADASPVRAVLRPWPATL
jgi:arylformamidase